MLLNICLGTAVLSWAKKIARQCQTSPGKRRCVQWTGRAMFGGTMLFLSALAIGMITGLQNVTTEVPTTESDGGSTVTEGMGLLETTKASVASDFVNVTIQERPSMWDMYLNHCPKWRPINHVFFQAANVFFLLSFLAPHTPSGLIWLRVALVLGCAFSGLWAWSIECYLDAVVWNSAFFIINFVYFAVQFYLMRPIKFHKDIEEVSLDNCFLHFNNI